MKMPTLRQLIIMIALLLIAPAVYAQSSKSASGGQSSEATRHDMALAAPGPVHKQLAKLAGSYDTLTKFYMEPGGKAVETPGSASIKPILDGRFLMEEASSTFMGQPTSSLRMLGYNNGSKQFEGIWTYTMSTAILRLTGTSKDDGKSIDFTASWDVSAAARETLEVVIRTIDSDHFAVELKSKQPDGKPGPTLITTYSRKK